MGNSVSWPKGKSRKGHVPVRKVSPVVIDGGVPDIHGVSSTAITEPCPNCGFAYADGGYCPDCGWALPFERLPHGTVTGRKRI